MWRRSTSLGLAIAAAWAGPACAPVRQHRTITPPVVDEHTGTVYAFETHDLAGRREDETVAVICNEELTGICYRVVPVDALEPADLRALGRAGRAAASARSHRLGAACWWPQRANAVMPPCRQCHMSWGTK